MGNIMPNWKEKTSFEKTISVIQIITCVSFIILSVLRLVGINNTLNAWVDFWDLPILAVIILMTSIQSLKYNKLAAYSCLAVSIFVLVCWVVVSFL